ncbi:MAG: MarR family winged helix-turn-helix transcriptional regulator, partial [Gemmatimonadaceae bacterium]
MATPPASRPPPPPRRIDGDLALRVADRLHSAAIHLLRRVRREDDRIGLSAPRLSALSVLVFGGPRTLGQLAAAEQVRPPTMTRLVTALEKRGLVKREPVPSDGRLTRIHATPKGRAVMLKGRARRVEALAEELRRLDSEEVATLARAAEIVEGLGAYRS